MAFHFINVTYKMEKWLKTYTVRGVHKVFSSTLSANIFQYFPVHQCPAETPDEEADQPSPCMGLCYVSQ